MNNKKLLGLSIVIIGVVATIGISIAGMDDNVKGEMLPVVPKETIPDELKENQPHLQEIEKTVDETANHPVPSTTPPEAPEIYKKIENELNTSTIVIVENCKEVYSDMIFLTERDCNKFVYDNSITTYLQNMKIACLENPQGLGYNSYEKCYEQKIALFEPLPYDYLDEFNLPNFVVPPLNEEPKFPGYDRPEICTEFMVKFFGMYSEMFDLTVPYSSPLDGAIDLAANPDHVVQCENELLDLRKLVQSN